MNIRKQLMRLLRQDPARPWKVKELSKSLGLAHEERASVRRLLWELVDEGHVISLPKRRFALSAGEESMVGTVQIDGRVGYVVPSPGRGREERIPIVRGSMRLVMDGDEVSGQLVSSRKERLFEVTSVRRRAHATVQGTYRQEGQAHVVVPSSHVFQERLLLNSRPPARFNVEDGAWVEVRILTYPNLVSSGTAEIEKVINEGDIVAQHVQTLIENSEVPVSFSKESIAYALSLGTTVHQEDTVGRTDLRELPLCTIDGETAKDFDDAVCALKNENGYTIIVAIADVAHYVTEGSELDEEAYVRGTSVYLPGRCIPMLPENLSNRLCSLEPNVDRLCMVVQFDIHDNGQIHDPQIYPAVMHSSARLTYEQVAELMNCWDNESLLTPGLEQISACVEESLYGLRESARLLRQSRRARGALDFSPTETTVLVGPSGEPTHVEIFKRHESHMLIEDLMIAANEIVAEWFEEAGEETLFRIHEEPDEEKLARFFDLFQFLNPTGRKTAVADSRHLSSMMRGMRHHHLQETLDTLLLRSMQQARYDTENVGHFGLSSEAYLHFTSPIRRYPDLIVHRRIKHLLSSSQNDNAWRSQALDRVAASCSEKERRAVQLERQTISFLSAWLMKKYVGEEIAGKVSGVTEFGIFVRLESPQVDGFCHISELTSDYLVFDEIRLCLTGQRSGFQLRIGDEVRVVVQNVQLDPPRIHLRLLQEVNDGERGGSRVNQRTGGRGAPQNRGHKTSRGQRGKPFHDDSSPRRQQPRRKKKSSKRQKKRIR